MRTNIAINTRLSPECRPGRDILLRVGGYKSTPIARRDLARYYGLLEAALQGLKGRFSAEELEALAHALESLAEAERPEPICSAPDAVEEAVRHEGLCEMAGIADRVQFVQRVRELDLAARYALVDAIGRYLAGQRGEEGWRKIGLL